MVNQKNQNEKNEQGKRKNLMNTLFSLDNLSYLIFIDSKWASESLNMANERSPIFRYIDWFSLKMMRTFVSPFVKYEMTIGGWVKF